MLQKTFTIILLIVLSALNLKTQAQVGEGISDVGTLHSLSSGITGKVFDVQTLLPITDATVNVVGMPMSATANHNGRFVIPTSPASGYSLGFSAPGHVPVTKTNITFNTENIAIVEDTYLAPFSEEEYDLVELPLNPNPQISEIKNGGLLKRYYQVVGKVSRIPTNGIEVEFESDGQYSKVFISENYNDQNGIIIVEFDQEIAIGCSNCSAGFRLVRVGTKIISASPITFRVDVEQREYQKEYEISREIEIGLGFAAAEKVNAKIGFQTGAKIILKQKFGELEPYKLGMDMSFENWDGLEIGVGIGTAFKANGLEVGGYGSAGVGAFVTFGIDGEYLYNYNSSTNNEEARAKFLNLSRAAYSISQNETLGIIALVLESTVISSDYLENIGGGPGIKGTYEGKAIVGVLTPREIGIQMGAKVSGSYEQGGKLRYERNIPNNLHYGSMTIYDKVSASSEVGLLNWGNPHKDNDNIKKIIVKSKLGLDYNSVDLIRSYSIKWRGNILNSPEIVIENKIRKSNWRRSFRMDYSHSNLNSLLGTPMLRGIISIADHTAPFVNFDPIAGGFINIAADNLLSNIADKQFSDNYPPLDYEIDSSKVDQGIGLHLNFYWDFLIHLDLGYNIDWNTTYKSLIEKGVFLGGNDYPLEQYTTIPEVSVPIRTVLNNIVWDGLNTITWSEFFSGVLLWSALEGSTGNDATEIIILSENGSSIEIDLSSIPPGLDSLNCYSWNWYGNSPITKLADLDARTKAIALEIKELQQSISKMEHGIGGFYKFEPQAVGLSIPAKLTIVYPDSDIVGIDENNLAIFYKDTTSSKWRFLGGVVEADSNRISVYVDTLQFYTVAPIMPSGEFGLETSQDTLVANEIDLATIISDTLKLADGQNVGDGVLYTVHLENLEVDNEDADTSLAGVQIGSINSLLQFQVKSTITPGIGKILIESVNGISKGLLELSVIDTTASVPLVLNNATAFDNGSIVYVTNPDTNDIVQYEVYFGLESGGPYLGIALAGGQNSPFIVGALDSAVINSLINDTTYYIALKSVDRGGNRSEFSNELTVVPTDTIAPGNIEEIDFTFMPDSSYFVRWIASGDNGIEGTANKYYLRISNQSIGDTTTWWQNASVVENVTAPNQSGYYDYQTLSNIDTTYYLGIQVEDEVGLKSSISIFQTNPNRGTRNITLKQGWNLISYPVKKSPLSIFDVLPFIESGPFIYIPATGYAQRDTITELQGCWIKVSDGYELNLNGRLIEDTLLAVQNGWNLIGGNSFITDTSDIYSQPEGIIQSVFWGYDTSGYYSASEIKYGNGYWVKADQDGYIILPNDSVLSKRSSNQELMKTAFEISCNGKKRILWIVDGKDLRRYEAPPLPPTEDIEVRFVGDLYAESKENSTYQISITNGKYPIQIKSMVEGEEFEVLGNITQQVYGKLSLNNSVRIDNEKDVLLTLNKVTVPTEYYLSQNYPNPFNPSTTIKFGLPKDQKVRVIVYDILGQEVERIVNNEQLKAGHHIIKWDASKFASGVYILNIEAGNFKSVKKMMLLK